MNQVAPLPLSVQIRNRSRSMGLKLLVVSFLALLMAIPAIFVSGIVEERTNRPREVIQEVSSRVVPMGKLYFLALTDSCLTWCWETVASFVV